MTKAPFVTSLRARPGTLRLAPPGVAVLTIRVQLAGAWDMVRVEAEPAERVANVKDRALEVLDPDMGSPGDYYVTLRGIRIPDEDVSLERALVQDGATLFVAYRHRRTIR